MLSPCGPDMQSTRFQSMASSLDGAPDGTDSGSLAAARSDSVTCAVLSSPSTRTPTAAPSSSCTRPASAATPRSSTDVSTGAPPAATPPCTRSALTASASASMTGFTNPSSPSASSARATASTVLTFSSLICRRLVNWLGPLTSSLMCTIRMPGTMQSCRPMLFTLPHVPSTTTSETRPGCARTHDRSSEAGRAPSRGSSSSDGRREMHGHVHVDLGRAQRAERAYGATDAERVAEPARAAHTRQLALARAARHLNAAIARRQPSEGRVAVDERGAIAQHDRIGLAHRPQEDDRTSCPRLKVLVGRAARPDEPPDEPAAHEEIVADVAGQRCQCADARRGTRVLRRP
eukprot:6680290-Prymnesium_polylepis.1